jgi:hypothetical protein
VFVGAGVVLFGGRVVFVGAGVVPFRGRVVFVSDMEKLRDTDAFVCCVAVNIAVSRMSWSVLVDRAEATVITTKIAAAASAERIGLRKGCGWRTTDRTATRVANVARTLLRTVGTVRVKKNDGETRASSLLRPKLVGS